MPNERVCYVEESLTPRVLQGWRRKLLRPLLGGVSFPAIDLPIDKHSDMTISPGGDNTPSYRRFRLWGLTLAMTRDLIQLTGQADLPFVALVAGTPRYSRQDIGMWIKCIALVSLWTRSSSSLSKR
jgi:hypothetical protein